MSKDKLSRLHTTLVDARAGYETAIDDAETAKLKAMFEQMFAIHGAAHSDIDKALVAKGEKPDESGSFMSTVHKAVISVRSAVTGVDENSLSSFVSGEQRIVEQYDEAIQDELDASTVAMLQYHKSRLLGMITRMQQNAA
ncbi:ferritin-like domain-containing protein [Mesorhizobium loti]|uniref:PA2169 family four-helix-bundle protein n=1 Tax=Mesorhizobium loti R88b TaxID=935548 RepID=A0A6M7WSQ6_RHILI|nr:PA2169 family four-helix-bundle protein [Mesorhizobium loti]QKD05262.1 PA2169 family four-helix-bundle protein [Mesorhizobium loti R88b]